MSDLEFALVLLLAAWCLFWIIRHDLIERRRRRAEAAHRARMARAARSTSVEISVDTSGFDEQLRRAMQATIDRNDELRGRLGDKL